MIKTVDCACLIHGDVYSWQYVENLRNMLKRHISLPINFHVFTEAERSVPPDMIKHTLMPWSGVSGPKQAWWYKVQMFDPRHDLESLLYFDLDMVILDNIDWICHSDLECFWTLRDFKYLWRPSWQGGNTSIMYWHTKRFYHVWQCFQTQGLKNVIAKYRGDQDFLTDNVGPNLRFLDEKRVISWRWQAKDGGMDFKTRTYRQPDAGTIIPAQTSVLVFHGKPKPVDVDESVIRQNWC